MTDREDRLQERAKKMANFCIGTGFPPEVYRSLTLREVEAFIKEANKRKR